MAGRKTPKDETTPSEAPKTAPDSATPDADSPKTAKPDQATAETPDAETPDKDMPAPQAADTADPTSDPVVVEESSAAVRAAGPDAGGGESSDPAPAPVVKRRGPGALPLVLGGVIAAALGFGAAQYANHGWPFGPGAAQDAALKQEVAGQASAIAALKAEVEKLDKAGSAMPGRIEALGKELGAKIALDRKAASAGIQANALAIDDLKTSITKIGSASARASGAVPPDVAAKLSALDQRVAALEKDVNGQIAAAQKAALAEKARAEAAATRAEARAALTRIDAALTAGGGFAPAVAQLQKDGVTVPPELAGVSQTGVPTLAALRADFDPAARKALAASVAGSVKGGIWSRLAAFVQVQTGARSLTPRAGDSPDAVLSRAQAALDKGDLSAAIKTLQALPKAGQAEMAPWVAKAEIRLKAEAAAKALATTLDGK
ncbi:hypothetical protein GCM10008024_01360 [Allgaiera indica]|uniref:Inner membrane protein n=2 Tax=Allgaiera indica TaxID=765699 RepID=A0AAN4UMN0_9RHOB|nr:hypothetical protein GCM10008024_01360 [Allgaiera indica]SDW49557.1 inner membrane protein [Allgaiera indica]